VSDFDRFLRINRESVPGDHRTRTSVELS
jgi:hypothetical protein